MSNIYGAYFRNSVYTAIQRAQGVQDSLELFQEDTLRMAKGMANPELVLFHSVANDMFSYMQF